ncbi:MAG: D-alanyl-D-alanine carboxypeptidase [Roseburia sp.]|nr:D-alanyl-D-alanine carboxypeptidase [Roseburia sp.]
MTGGCGTDASALETPYDIYQTTQTVGLSQTETAAEKTYFASDLCVAENVSIGTDGTHSEVAEGAGTFNLATNSVVYAKNLFEKLYPASTTKILTAYIALKYCDDLDTLVTVSENAVDQASDSSVCNLKAGDVISMRDLLYGLMLRSGNDAAVAIAEYISGDVDSFAALMNEEATAIGATRSHFVNPNGLPDENHYTTVYDMYLIFNRALENETFVDLISTKSYDTAYTNAQGELEEHTWENTNQYLTGATEAPEGFTVVGGKTGTTGDAGYCLVLYSYNAANQPIISIVFKADGRSNLYLLMNEMLAGYAN